MDCKIGDVVRFGRYDDRIGVVIGVEEAGAERILLVRTPQNVLYGQEHDFCTSAMNPRRASEGELVAASIALRNRALRDMDAYLARFNPRLQNPQVWRLMASLALLANAVALVVLFSLSSDVPLMAVIASAAAFVAVLSFTFVVDPR